MVTVVSLILSTDYRLINNTVQTNEGVYLEPVVFVGKMPLALERSDKSQLEVPVEMDGEHLNRVANTHVKLQFESRKKIRPMEGKHVHRKDGRLIVERHGEGRCRGTFRRPRLGLVLQ